MYAIRSYYGLIELAQLAHDRADVLFGGNEEHLVVGFDYGASLGKDSYNFI